MTKSCGSPDTDRLALLSCMFPEKRTDRVYWLKDTNLARIIGRWGLLGLSRREELEKWRVSGGADLGQCVENVMRQAENHIVSGQEVTVEEIDTALNMIASRCRFSGPSVRRQRSAVDVEETLAPLYRRLSSRDAKWLTRMILKTHISDTLPERLTLKSFHFLLPHLLLFQNSFEAAVTLLSSEPIIHFPPRPEIGYARDLGKIALHHLIPKIGIKIGRPEYLKARSIKHCCNMVGQRRMSVERKYDGPAFLLEQKAILRQFYPARPLHAVANKSRPQPYECLMMVFFDILVLDDDILLRKPHRERRLLLKNTIQVISGVSDIADQRIIDFSRSDGQAKLETLFSKGIAERWEGFILKGCEDPYFPILVESGIGCEGRWIKLKKDYIPGLGDTVDLVLVGAAYNARDATILGLAKKETWTHFFVGCLENKEAVLRSKNEPRFRIIDVIDQHGISRANMQNLNSFGKYSARSVDSDDGVIIGEIRPGLPTIDVVFKTPFVVEVMGSGFVKPSGARYYTIRFPRILKIHSDRSIEDAASFRELQVLAEMATSVSSEELLDEEAEWTNRVRSGTSKPGHCPDESQNVSTVSPPASAKAIPIYIDCSPPSSSNGSPGSNVLANNSNLSSQGNAKKRKALPYASEPCAKNTYGGLDRAQKVTKVVNPALVVTSPAQYLATKVGPPRSDHASTDIQKVSASERKADSEEPSRSPLARIPIYIHPETASEVQTTFNGLSNVSHTIEEFLRMLNFDSRRLGPEKSNLFPASENITLGIMFANISRDPLGPTLLELSKHISNALTTPPCSHNPTGRVFLLNSNFLNLVVDWKNHIFCLRKTWDKISRFPSTPLDAEHLTENSIVTTTTRRTQPIVALRRSLGPVSAFIPEVRISFDRKQILVLVGS
ncbi:hypothetical protein AN8014.2 [Aspergillus nidulans FGSC A4]|uniref:ATP dependent DNA ligase domain protein (AFU_orthologue AFUA_5G02430) n=1 Tax=Emericella nidulans (strain FGSC A4 / ATCC 38163 / CBS 112.46 / NRRL 194 / M139) TaxID=227321 RepID=Q5AUL6_EMENI|nr:hypothetical protein [Aspergillus nidulans FGSC A4]EAA59636.1 hypothetical protein AN8014.2 [Aspergillus nidulans FGSC A4]CBF73707.1 TPA: ATP dependent DNA ligase domain protein (AFU_orthologue; AFUA_5G02430) [Aspergillus nidulans FGSC A4]|eukprot:XP_681283.1 hypothetical protein AN8014.2 [Aspergillus nidulans FGSC A4]